MKIAFAIAVAYAVIFFASNAKSFPICLPIERAMDLGITYGDEPAKLILRLEGEEAEEFIETYNSIPPITEYEADAVLLYDHPNAKDLYLGLFKDGCMKSKGNLKRGDFNYIMERMGRDDRKLVGRDA